MKSVEELQSLLLLEIIQSISHIKSIPITNYYNEIMGDTSILLTSLLEEHLLECSDWDSNKWLDDSLLTDIKLLSNNKFSIKGIIIWGRNNTSEEWTEPFSFEIKISDELKHYDFLFGDANKPEISYDEYKVNRNYWSHKIIHWKYKFKAKF
ncbi:MULTISPECIES: hypothetical protein [unclassified Chryseobacterium]|uniref:hypothetical protein n=1 Tax=unclassified Chryseobacterium TaxID=2593645 RepID=UPI000F45134E|nr:hypothetical protein [Chryseobacterium sp. G0240]ROI02150.1 hypothetical protein EGI16_14830 [Chryseobacterium sp. G0240]